MEEDERLVSLNVYPKVFGLMFLGLALTALLSWFCYNTGVAQQFISDGTYSILLIVELVVVILFSLLLRKVSPMVATALFFIYAGINGVSLSIIYYIYELQSIITILFIAAGLFGTFAFLGHTAKVDLTKLGTLCFGVLIAGIIASIINLFLKNEFMDIVLSWVILIVFFGITAYDMQKIKHMALQGSFGDKLYVYGALELYLDFINIFIRLLSLFGKRR